MASPAATTCSSGYGISAPAAIQSWTPGQGGREVGWREASNPGQKASETRGQLRDKRGLWARVSKDLEKALGHWEVKREGTDLGAKIRVGSGDCGPSGDESEGEAVDP